MTVPAHTAQRRVRSVAAAGMLAAVLAGGAFVTQAQTSAQERGDAAFTSETGSVVTAKERPYWYFRCTDNWIFCN